MKKVLIVYESIHKGNTKKIAEALAEVLEADLKKPKEVDINMMGDYELFGFGSGVYFNRLHASVRKLIDKLPDNMDGRRAFVFSTYGSFIKFKAKKELKKLKEKNFEVIGEFGCRGFDSWGPFKLIGGLAKGRPDDADIEEARRFGFKIK